MNQTRTGPFFIDTISRNELLCGRGKPGPYEPYIGKPKIDYKKVKYDTIH